MKITVDSFKQYTDNAPKYKDGMIFVQSGVEKKDVDALIMWLRRLCAKNDGLSFMLVTSSHDSKGNIRKEKVYTGKAGRPRVVVKGKDAEKHCHGLLVNERDSISRERTALQKYFNKRRKKRANLKQQKVMQVWQGNLSIVKYMIRQADSTFRYGAFDFDYFNDPYYMPERPDNFDNIFDHFE